MRSEALTWLVCPICGEPCESRESLAATSPATDLPVREVMNGTLTCSSGHRFPIVDGVPRLLLEGLLESGDAHSMRESFSRQWEHFDYEADDKTWGQTVETRTADFLRMVDQRPDELAGKLILDAGCGNGVLSNAITAFGCDVLAADISSSVSFAFRRFGANPRLHFVQADLMNPPFRPQSFDIVFCAGVLIVTPDSRATFERVADAVGAGGRLFVWVYWKEPKARYRFKVFLRRVLAPMPLSVKRAVALGFVPQALARQWLRARRRPEVDGDNLNWREHFVVQHDFFTPRYRWEHTPEEVHEWYRELGFDDIKTTEAGPAGFGVVARRPVDVSADSGSASRAEREASAA